MQKNRRDFIKLGGLAGLSIAGSGAIKTIASTTTKISNYHLNDMPEDPSLNLIGQYGPWAADLRKDKLPALSFRNSKFNSVKNWKPVARAAATGKMGIPDIGGIPHVSVIKKYIYDGLSIEELSWQLPYGRPTSALLLKPENANGPLPGILAFHDHGGNKYFGSEKITRTGTEQHTMMKDHQTEYYEGTAWANEIAKKGYVVLVSDSFSFASRRVRLAEVPAVLRDGLSSDDPTNEKDIHTYNNWASGHEHVMSKSLFCAGTTWPGVFFAEDKIALDILCARKDVDASKIGCGGLSGGGIRTNYMAGLDARIKCSVTVGFMSTWKDFLLNKSYTHTWMTYVPLLPNDLDFPEILGLRVPLPTLVLNDEEDTLYTMPEMKEADKILRTVFNKAGAADRYQCSFYPGPHKFDIAMQKEAFAWFDKWLKPM